MGFLDMFKKKDEFDDLLKEPDGGKWDLGPSQNPGMGGDDFMGSMPASDMLGSQSNGVMGLPPQSRDTGLGMDSDVPNFNDDNSFSSGNTGASALNLNTSYPSNPGGISSRNNNPYGNSYPSQQRPQYAEEKPHVGPGALATNQELDLIITKLDLLKSTMQNLDNRLYHIEKKLFEEPTRRNQW